ncbi:MAG: restriction endonuclease subunit S, partial [Proteobacteria bacterium]|nr:restriction endonuclease subunit S [Pseudomonadota bacterium]
MTTTENVPQLRFPEFSREWKKTVIGKVLTIGSGKDYKHLSSGDVPVFGTGGYMLSVNDYLYDGESVCIGRKGTIDKPVFVTGKFWTVDTLFYTHSFVNALPKFIYAYFQRVNWKLYNEASGVPSLSKTTIEEIGITIPSLPEQTKIASFLSAVDTKIDQLTQKKALLETYKKGAMQQIFSQQIRFTPDEGGEYPDWEEKKLGKVIESLPTKKYQLSSSNFEQVGSYPIIDQGSDFIAGFSNCEELVFSNIPVIIFGDHTTILKYIDFNFIVGADGTKILKPISLYNSIYIFYNIHFKNEK